MNKGVGGGSLPHSVTSGHRRKAGVQLLGPNVELVKLRQVWSKSILSGSLFCYDSRAYAMHSLALCLRLGPDLFYDEN